MHELVRLMPSPRELMVLQMAVAGMADKEIAQRLRITSATVRKYFERVEWKLGAKNRCQAAHIATAEGLIEQPGGAPFSG